MLLYEMSVTLILAQQVSDTLPPRPSILSEWNGLRELVILLDLELGGVVHVRLRSAVIQSVYMQDLEHAASAAVFLRVASRRLAQGRRLAGPVLVVHEGVAWGSTEGNDQNTFA